MQLGRLIYRERKVFATVSPSWYSAGASFCGSSKRAGAASKTGAVVGQRDAEALAIGGSLLMGEREAAQRLRQGLGGRRARRRGRCGRSVIGTDRLRPESQLDRLGDPRRSGA